MNALKQRFSLCFTVIMLLSVSDVWASIDIVTQPKRTLYNLGEEIDLTGLTARITNDDGSSETISADKFTVSGYNSNLEGSQLVALKYGDDSVLLSVRVKQQAIVRIAADIVNKHRFVGDVVSRSDFVVIAYCDTGNWERIYDFNVEAPTLKEGGNMVTISYLGNATNVVVNAQQNYCTGLRLVDIDKDTFGEYEEFSTEGLCIMADFIDGSSVDVTNICDYNIPEFNVGDSNVVATYDNISVTIPIRVVSMEYDHMDTSMWDSDREVLLYFKDIENPVKVSQDIWTSKDSTSMSFTVKYKGKTFMDTIPISYEVKKTRHISVDIPVNLGTSKLSNYCDSDIVLTGENLYINLLTNKSCVYEFSDIYENISLVIKDG